MLVPLFSIPSSESWGVGEIPDLPRLAAWVRSAGLDFVQLLPVQEMEEGQSSPYSALTAMALDPVFIGLRDVPDFVEQGGEAALDRDDQERLHHVRHARWFDFRNVRALKARALRAAFASFRARHLDSASERDRAFSRFQEQESWWLDEYSLFRALHEEHRGRYWKEWDPPLRHRDPQALAQARARLSAQILYYRYVQWLADEQWQRARRDCGTVGIFGDFPFMVSGHSADVWSRQHEFDADASVGVPPDAFSETGQDWGLPAYRWDVQEQGDFEWLRQRMRRCVELYDGYRIDHLVGFYRTYVRARDGRAGFVPAEEGAQLRQGEHLLTLFKESGARIIAEDLGMVPDFVRDSLARLGIPGLKVLRWERKWEEPGQPFREPFEYAADSVAISGTHDTETLADWWDGADAEERRLCAELTPMRERGCRAAEAFSPATHDALLHTIFSARSDFVILPIQDLFGWRDRVNTPAVVSDENWTWRLPWPVERLPLEAQAQQRAAYIRELAQRTGRGR